MENISLEKSKPLKMKFHLIPGELVNYHKKKPITKTGEELLLTPCNRSTKLPPLVFQGLLKN